MADTITTQVGLFVPTNFIWDVQQLNQTEVGSPEFKELLVRLYQNINLMCIALNLKESGYYILQEFVNGQSWFPNPAYTLGTTSVDSFRQGFTTTVNFGALPDSGKKSVKHYVNPTVAFMATEIWSAATNPGVSFIPIPFVDVTGVNPVQIDIDPIYVNITTISDMSAYTECVVVFKYLKN